MNTWTVHSLGRRSRAGFTMIEMSAALSVMLVLAVAMVVMLQQHVQFMQMAQKQTFLADEAPKIGNMLGRIINQADHYFVYASKDAAMAGATPTMNGGRAVRLYYKTANQDMAMRVVAMETLATGPALRFYGWQGGVPSSWTISSRLADTTFQSDQGILSIVLDGPNGERVTYGGGVK